MDKLLSVALEELALEGPAGCPVREFRPRFLRAAAHLLKVEATPFLFAAAWRALWQESEATCIMFHPPASVTVTQRDKYWKLFDQELPVNWDSDRIARGSPEVATADAAEAADVWLLACQHLRDSAIDVVDCRHSGVLLSKQQRTALELIGRARYNGIVITEASTVMKMDTKALFYVLMMLVGRGLVAKTPVLLDSGERVFSTSILHLSRFLPPMEPGTRYEIPSIIGTKPQVCSTSVQPLWMDAVCKTLAAQPGQCALEADIKYKVGLRSTKQAHRTWRLVKGKLVGDGNVNIYTDVVDGKSKTFMKLEKMYSGETEEGGGDDDDEEEGELKDVPPDMYSGRHCLKVIVETGTEGCTRRGLEKACRMPSKVAMRKLETFAKDYGFERQLIQDKGSRTASYLFKAPIAVLEKHGYLALPTPPGGWMAAVHSAAGEPTLHRELMEVMNAEAVGEPGTTMKEEYANQQVVEDAEEGEEGEDEEEEEVLTLDWQLTPAEVAAAVGYEARRAAAAASHRETLYESGGRPHQPVFTLVHEPNTTRTCRHLTGDRLARLQRVLASRNFLLVREIGQLLAAGEGDVVVYGHHSTVDRKTVRRLVDALEKQGFAEMKTIPFMPDGETTSEQVEVVVDPRQTMDRAFHIEVAAALTASRGSRVSSYSRRLLINQVKSGMPQKTTETVMKSIQQLQVAKEMRAVCSLRRPHNLAEQGPRVRMKRTAADFAAPRDDGARRQRVMRIRVPSSEPQKLQALEGESNQIAMYRNGYLSGQAVRLRMIHSFVCHIKGILKPGDPSERSLKPIPPQHISSDGSVRMISVESPDDLLRHIPTHSTVTPVAPPTSTGRGAVCAEFTAEEVLQRMPVDLYYQLVGALLWPDNLTQLLSEGKTMATVAADELQGDSHQSALATARLLTDLQRLWAMGLLVEVSASGKALYGNKARKLRADTRLGVSQTAAVEFPTTTPFSGTTSWRLFDFGSDGEEVHNYWAFLAHLILVEKMDVATADRCHPFSRQPALRKSKQWREMQLMGLAQYQQMMARMTEARRQDELHWVLCAQLAEELSLSYRQVLAHSYKLKSKIDPDVEFETRRGRRAGVGSRRPEQGPKWKRRRAADREFDDPLDARAYRTGVRRAKRQRADGNGTNGNSYLDRSMKESPKKENVAEDAAFGERTRNVEVRSRYVWSQVKDDALLRAMVRHRVKHPWAPNQPDFFQGLPCTTAQAQKRMKHLSRQPTVASMFASLEQLAARVGLRQHWKANPILPLTYRHHPESSQPSAAATAAAAAAAQPRDGGDGTQQPHPPPAPTAQPKLASTEAATAATAEGSAAQCNPPPSTPPTASTVTPAPPPPAPAPTNPVVGQAEAGPGVGSPKATEEEDQTGDAACRQGAVADGTTSAQPVQPQQEQEQPPATEEAHEAEQTRGNEESARRMRAAEREPIPMPSAMRNRVNSLLVGEPVCSQHEMTYYPHLKGYGPALCMAADNRHVKTKLLKRRPPLPTSMRKAERATRTWTDMQRDALWETNAEGDSVDLTTAEGMIDTLLQTIIYKSAPPSHAANRSHSGLPSNKNAVFHRPHVTCLLEPSKRMRVDKAQDLLSEGDQLQAFLHLSGAEQQAGGDRKLSNYLEKFIRRADGGVAVPHEPTLIVAVACEYLKGILFRSREAATLPLEVLRDLAERFTQEELATAFMYLRRQGLVNTATSAHPFRLTSDFFRRLKRGDLHYPEDLFEDASQADDTLDRMLAHVYSQAPVDQKDRRRALVLPHQPDSTCGIVAQTLQRLALDHLDLVPHLYPRESFVAAASAVLDATRPMLASIGVTLAAPSDQQPTQPKHPTVAGRVMRPSDAVSAISDGAVGAARPDQGWTLDEVAGDPSARSAAEAAFLRHCEEEGLLRSSPTAGEALLASLQAAGSEGMSAAALAAAVSGRAEGASDDEVGAILTAALRFALAAPLTAFRGVAYVSAECSAALRVRGGGGLCCWVDHRGEVTQGVVEAVQERACALVARCPGIPEPQLMEQLEVLSPMSVRMVLAALVGGGVLTVREAVRQRAAPPAIFRRSRSPKAATSAAKEMERFYFPSLKDIFVRGGTLNL